MYNPIPSSSKICNKICIYNTWLNYFNFDSLKVNISFHDRNFWLSKTFPVCLCQLFQLFSPNKLHCSSHWTSIYKMLEIKLFYFVISELSTKLPQGNRSSWTFLTISSDSPFTLFDYHRLITSTWTLFLTNARKIVTHLEKTLKWILFKSLYEFY